MAARKRARNTRADWFPWNSNAVVVKERGKAAPITREPRLRKDKAGEIRCCCSPRFKRPARRDASVLSSVREKLTPHVQFALSSASPNDTRYNRARHNNSVYCNRIGVHVSVRGEHFDYSNVHSLGLIRYDLDACRRCGPIRLSLAFETRGSFGD